MTYTTKYNVETKKFQLINLKTGKAVKKEFSTRKAAWAAGDRYKKYVAKYKKKDKENT
jgi:hypothetical protein